MSQKQLKTAIETKALDKPAQQAYATYWMTRDRTDGALDDMVDVWIERPDRLQFSDGDVLWITPVNKSADVRTKSALYGTWTLDQARTQVGDGVPEDDRQCLRIGHTKIVKEN